MEATAIVAPPICSHGQATIVFNRSGTRLHPIVEMIEVCIDCDLVLDRKRLTRGESRMVNG